VKKTGGSGLGLAIAKEIIERHGGNLRAENDNGARFIIEL
jgi:two-component system sensor histidine kinase VanS